MHACTVKMNSTVQAHACMHTVKMNSTVVLILQVVIITYFSFMPPFWDH